MQPSDPDWVKTAKAGDEVVYVVERPPVDGFVSLFGREFWRRRLIHNLTAGRIYKIQAVEMITDYRNREFVAFRIKGSRLSYGIFSVPFPASWFRPPHRRPTDISIFQSMLNNSPAQAARTRVPL